MWLCPPRPALKILQWLPISLRIKPKPPNMMPLWSSPCFPHPPSSAASCTLCILCSRFSPNISQHLSPMGCSPAGNSPCPPALAWFQLLEITLWVSGPCVPLCSLIRLYNFQLLHETSSSLKAETCLSCLPLTHSRCSVPTREPLNGARSGHSLWGPSSYDF